MPSFLARLQYLGLHHSNYCMRVLSTGLNYWSDQMSNMKDDTSTVKPIESSIQKKLTDTFSPTHLEILNESYMHNVPRGAETHFKVVVVSEKFENLPLIKKHRMVNSALAYELQNGLHALSIVAKTPLQWETSSQEIASSPPCRGGFGK